MIERYATAAILSKVLGTNLNTREGVDYIRSSRLPDFFKSDSVLQFLRATSTDGTVMGVLSKLSELAQSSPTDRVQFGVKAAASLLPDHAPVIEGAAVAYLEEPEVFEEYLKSFATKDRLATVVRSAIIKPELVRCPDCLQSFLTDGTEPCPFCQE